jgi:hypothetical protein
MKGQETSFIDYAYQFDTYDYNGNGKLYSNDNSKTSSILQAIFGDSFTRDINEKIINFKENINNIDLADITSVDNLGSMLGIPDSGFSGGMPKELMDVVKLASLNYNDLFGYENNDLYKSENNMGSLLKPEDMITADQLLFISEFGYDAILDTLIVPPQTSLTAFDDTVITGTEGYPLIELNHPIYDLTNYSYYSAKEQDSNNLVDELYRRDSFIDVRLLPNGRIPSKEEWLEIINEKIEYLLVSNIL